MKLRNIKWRRIFIPMAITIIVFFVLLLAFISPIAKYIVEKYDEKWTGRQIKLGWVYVNPFTGFVHINNLRVFEYQSDTVFFSARSVNANFAIFKMLKKTYEIENITINEPVGYIKQNGKQLNFDDMIQKFSPKDTLKKDENKEPVHFNILKIAIKDGEFHYDETSIPVTYFVKHVNIESPGKWWNVDSMNVDFALQSGPLPGDLKGNFMLNFDSLEYRLAAKINKYELEFLEQYMRDFANFGTFTANLDADIQATGNLGSKMALTTGGFVALNDFHFGKVKGEDYASFNKLAIKMDKVDPRNYEYYIDTFMLDRPFFRYERYDNLDNIQRIFGKGGSNVKAANADTEKFNLLIEIAKFVRDLAKNFAESYYKVHKVAVYSANFQFADYSLRDKFEVKANPLYLIADSLDKNRERINVRLNTNLKPYGQLLATLSFDPNDYGYFDLYYHLQRVPLSMFNPYVVSYTSFPLDRGTLEFQGDLNVLDSKIKSDNHLLIIDARTAKRVKKRDTRWIPVPLIMSIARDRSEVIDYDIPLYGDLKDPKFRLWNVIGHIITNVIVKPPSTPYLVHVKQKEAQVERFMTVKWEMHQKELRPVQEKFLGEMSDFLKKTPEASLKIYPLIYVDKEKEHILYFEAKKKYYTIKNHISNGMIAEDDSIAIEKMSVKDSGFVHYLDKLIGDTLMFTQEEKCKFFLGQAIVEQRFAQLEKNRLQTFASYFQKDKVDDRLKFQKAENEVPYNGFSYYKIEYNGDFPDKLRKAYEEMEELNEERPRGEYEKERKKYGGILLENQETGTPQTPK